MRLTAILLLTASLHAWATGRAQITLSEKKASLGKVLESVKKQSGYSLFFDESLVQDKGKPVNISVKNVTVDQALEQIFKDQLLTYELTGKIISVKEKGIGTPPVPVLSSPIEIHGRVTDTAGNPLVGASVTVKGASMIVQTNEKGDFVLRDVDERGSVLVSYVGYNTMEVKLTGKAAYGLSVVLRHNKNPLDEVQITAYGTTTRRFSVGAISTVTADDIEKQPVTNVLLALEGRVPGLTINPTSGAPGSAVQVQVRGQNTLRNNPNASIPPFDQPLFILDGIPLAAQNVNINLLESLAGTNSYPYPFSGISGFNGINPADIESITVLKDADATSIYGSQGANGVILITTKKGKPGKTELNITANTGPNSITRQVQMLNTQQYLQVRKDALAYDGIDLAGANPLEFPDLLLFDQGKYTNWFHQFYGKTSENTDIHASLSGGNATSTFLVSAGGTSSSYNFPGDYADNRLTFHSAFHHNSTDQRLTLDLGTDLSYDHNNNSSAPQAGQALLMPPNLPDLLDPSGNLVWAYNGADLSSYQEYAYLKQPADLKAYDVNSNMGIGYRLANGLKLSATLGYSRLSNDEYSATPIAAQPTSPYTTGYANFSNSSYQTINIEPHIDYKHTIGKGKLTALLGGTYKKSITASDIMEGSNYTSDDLLTAIAAAPTITASNNNTIYKYSAVFGRLGYIYNDRYVVDLTGRRDGSSNFGPGRQFGSFGSAGAGWIFSEENLFKNSLPFLSYGKLAVNYGTNGSDGIAPYQYQAFWQVAQNVPSFQGAQPYQPVNLYNPDYGWSTKKAWNASFDAGLLKDRILLNVNWYRDRTGDQLTNYALPIQTGFTSVLGNFIATVQNKGWEITLSSINIKHGDFNWTTNLNMSINRNKLIAFPGLESSSYATYYAIGKSTSTYIGYRYKDVNPSTGVFEFLDSKGNPTYTPNYGVAASGGDMAPVADLQPKFQGGIGNTLSYKGLSVFFFFQFAKQTGLNYLYAVYSNAVPGTMFNIPVQALDYWKKPGDVTALQAPTTGYGSNAYNAVADFIYSSGAYSDASYVRLKTVSVSYDLPGKWLKPLHVKSCKLYVNAQNLLTFTGYKVGDPELPGQLFSIPLQRTVAGGLSFNF